MQAALRSETEAIEAVALGNPGEPAHDEALAYLREEMYSDADVQDEVQRFFNDREAERRTEREEYWRSVGEGWD